MNRYKLTFTCEAITFKDNLYDGEMLSTIGHTVFQSLESLGKSNNFIIGQELTNVKVLSGSGNETP